MRDGSSGDSESCLFGVVAAKAPFRACAVAVTFATLMLTPAHAAEYGTGPWAKGYTDIFGGVLPSQPGFYSRTDAYHYNGDADATIRNWHVPRVLVDEHRHHGRLWQLLPQARHRRTGGPRSKLARRRHLSAQSWRRNRRAARRLEQVHAPL